MKGLIALAKKNESISDKIVRLYKEGYSIPEIAKEMEMPKDNVMKTATERRAFSICL